MEALKIVYARIVESGPRTIGEYLLFGGLLPLSCFYGLVVRVRRCLYQLGLKKVYRASVPVISVGNLTVGGTGKTPMADYLVKRLQGKGLKCAIVSRGYGGTFRGDVGRVSRAEITTLMEPEACGDEPYLLAQKNPGVAVYVARQRALGVRQAEADGAEVVILDDGFQHLAVARDLNILLLDATAPFGNGQLLPAGNLREPLAAIRHSDLVILTRATEGVVQPGLSGMPVLQARHELRQILIGPDGDELNLQDVRDKRCLAFAGIARPEGFFTALRQAGLQNLTNMPLADHQDYTPEVLERLRKACHNHDLAVTTEKDAVKLDTADFPIPVYRVGVELAFERSEALDQMIDQLVEHNS